jgi:hypothetical protein
MAGVALGLFLGGIVTAIPVVTGVAEGVEFQKKQNEEAANETRMIKFNILTSCDADDELADEIDEGIVILRHSKVRAPASFLYIPPLHPSIIPQSRPGPLTAPSSPHRSGSFLAN